MEVMAAALETANEFETRFQSVTVCSICDKRFTDPRILPCFHTFCIKCIKAEVRLAAHKNAISCPACKTDFGPAITKVASIPSNAYVTRLILTANVLGVCPTTLSTDPVNWTDDYGYSRPTTASRSPIDYETRWPSKSIGLISKVSPARTGPIDRSDSAQLQQRRKSPKLPRKLSNLYCIDCKLSIGQLCTMEHSNHSLMNAATDTDELRKMTNSYWVGVDACHGCNALHKLPETTCKVSLKTAPTVDPKDGRSVSRVGSKSSRPRPKPANPQSPSLPSNRDRDRTHQLTSEWKKLNQRFYEEVTTNGFRSDISKTADELRRLWMHWCHQQESSDRQSQKKISPQGRVDESESGRDSSGQMLEMNQRIQELLADKENLEVNEIVLMDTIETQRNEMNRKLAELEKKRDNLWICELKRLAVWIEKIDSSSVEYRIITEREKSENIIIKNLQALSVKKRKELIAKKQSLLNKIAELNQEIVKQKRVVLNQPKLESKQLFKTETNQPNKIHKLEQQINQLRDDLAQKHKTLQEKLEAVKVQENRLEKSKRQVTELQLRLQNESETNQEFLRNKENMREKLAEKERLWNTKEKEFKRKIREMESHINQLQNELKERIDSDKNFRGKLELAVIREGPLFANVTDVKHPLTLNRTKTCNESSSVQIAAYRLPNLRAPKGIRNLGNTCYFGAAIQTLKQAVLLTDELFSTNKQSSQSIQLNYEHSLIITYLEFLQKGYENKSEELLRQLIGEFFKKAPRFADRGQHDSHDLLMHFLNCLRGEERRRHGSSSSAGFRNELTAVDKVFGGHTITVYVCHTCGAPDHVCEPFLDLSLPILGPEDGPEEEKEEEDMFVNTHNADIVRHLTGYDAKRYESRNQAVKATMRPLGVRPRSKAQQGLFQKSPTTKSLGGRSMKQCLTRFTRIERIRNEYLCRRCQTIGQPSITSASKRTLIYNPPAVLVLHLKRFEQSLYGFEKCNQLVAYEEYLDIGPYCSSYCLRLEPHDANIWYSLYGVVVHRGSLSAGHYVSYIKVRGYDTRQAKKFLQETFLRRDQVLNDDDIRLIITNRGMHTSREEWHPAKVDDRWYLVDDEDVKVVETVEVLSQEAYLLFYERVAKPTIPSSRGLN